MALPEKRWVQRLYNYEKAVAVLDNAFRISQERDLTELERMGLIQAFEFAFELAWNLMKDFLQSRGVFDIGGSKDAVRQAFSHEIIENGEIWMDMIDRRNETSHCYDEEIAIRVITEVTHSFVEELKNFLTIMKQQA
jgi:nucleotidyltransferase substrate binding protein (TIGR01987 family)